LVFLLLRDLTENTHQVFDAELPAFEADKFKLWIAPV